MAGPESEEEGPVQPQPVSPPKLSFGTVMLNAPPAPGFSGPQEELPGLWLVEFKQRHAEPAVYNGLFTSCRPGRDWVLQHCSRSKLTIDTTTELSRAEWARRLDAARQALQTRGALPTHLVVLLQDGRCGEEACALLPGCLDGAAGGIHELTLQEMDVPPWEPTPGVYYGPAYRPRPRLLPQASQHAAGLLSSTAAALTALHTLTLKDFLQTLRLPNPEALPSLRVIWLTKVQGSEAAVSAYLPQLTSLHMAFSNEAARWSELFNPATTTHTLAHFSTDKPLTSQLLGLLLKHAPALRHLDVQAIRVELQRYRAMFWGLESLVISGHDTLREEVANLPRSAKGRIAVSLTRASLYIRADAEGMSPGMAASLSSWQLVAGRLCLFPDRGLFPDSSDDSSDENTVAMMPAPNQAKALSTTLAQLQHWQTGPDAWVELQDWVWTDETAQVLATALPTLPHVNVGVDVGCELTDELLAVAARMGPGLCRLTAEDLKLQADHSSDAWSGAELHVSRLSLAQAVRLPRGPAGWVIARCDASKVYKMTVDTKVIKEVGVNRLVEWVKTALAPMSHISVTCKADKHSVSTCDDEQCAQLLRDQLTVLRAVPWDSKAPDARVSVHLQGWSLTEHTMAALAGLPHWSGELSLVLFAGWPLEPAKYEELACHVPTSYRQWCVNHRRTSQVLQCICTGVDAQREGKGLPPLRVRPLAMAQQRDVRVGEHVIVTGESLYSG